MQRRRTEVKKIYYRHYTDEQITDYLEIELGQSIEFKNHCFETARNLGISEQVVKDVLMDYAFQTIKLLQAKALKKEKIKIQHYGWLKMKLYPRNHLFKFLKTKRS